MSVVALVGVMMPPSGVDHVTGELATTFPYASSTRTTNRFGIALPTSALCPSPLMMTRFDAGAPVAVDVKVRVARPADVAVSVCTPVPDPRLHRARARPSESVEALSTVTVPEPDVTVNVTGLPATGFPNAS